MTKKLTMEERVSLLMTDVSFAHDLLEERDRLAQQVETYASAISTTIEEIDEAKRAIEWLKGLAQKAVIADDPLDQEEIAAIFPEEEGWKNDGDGWYQE